MKQSSKRSASMSGNGDFDEELQSDHHTHTYNNCNNIHHHHNCHFHNEATGGEKQNPPLKQADLVKATPSSFDEEQKHTETTSPLTQSLPINGSPPTEKPYVLIQNGADPNYFLSVRDGRVVVALFALGDESQHWYQFVNNPDKFGPHCCCLVNKATGEAIKHPDDEDSPVNLITYDPRVLDESIVWKLDRQPCIGVAGLSTCITPFDYPRYTLEARFSSGRTSDGGAIVYVIVSKLDNSNLWKIIDYQKPVKLVMLEKQYCVKCLC